MDLFFIFFIIYIIYSIISRIARAVQQGSSQPSAAPPRSPQRAETVLREILGHWEEAGKGGETVQPSFEPLPPQEDYTGRYYPRTSGYAEESVETLQPYKIPAIEIPAEKQPRKDKQPRKKFLSPPEQRLQPREAHTSVTPAEACKPAAPFSNLAQLLYRENLPQAIIAAEVLAAPRCKRPLSRRLS